jgi:hypothetical protein
MDSMHINIRSIAIGSAQYFSHNGIAMDVKESLFCGTFQIGTCDNHRGSKWRLVKLQYCTGQYDPCLPRRTVRDNQRKRVLRTGPSIRGFYRVPRSDNDCLWLEDRSVSSNDSIGDHQITGIFPHTHRNLVLIDIAVAGVDVDRVNEHPPRSPPRASDYQHDERIPAPRGGDPLARSPTRHRSKRWLLRHIRTKWRDSVAGPILPPHRCASSQ